MDPLIQPGVERRCPITTDLEVLRTPSARVTREEVERMKLPQVLKLAQRNGWTSGAGIAAIQVGIPIRFAVYEFTDVDKETKARRPVGPVYLLNPTLLKASTLVQHLHEACLSLPHRYYNAWRFETVEVYNDWDGQVIRATGFEAFVLQHEMDHMDGQIGTDRGKIERNAPCPCGSWAKTKRCCLA